MKNSSRTVRLLEAFGGWMLERSIIYLGYGACIGLIFCVGIQIGLHKGREIEKERIGTEIAEMNIAMTSLEAEVERLSIEKTVAEIIDCESGGLHDGVWGDGGRAYGITQAHFPTFEWLKAKAGMPHLDWRDREDQVALLTWAVANGYGNLWSCFKGTPLEKEVRRHGQEEGNSRDRADM